MIVAAAMSSEGEEHVLPRGKVLPLNSRWLMTAHVRALAEKLGLPTRAATEELRQLIEGKLADMGREPKNVQVILKEPEEGTEEEMFLFLVDADGVFAETVLPTELQQTS